MSEETNETFKIRRLSRRNFLGVGTTILVAAAGMPGLSTDTQLEYIGKDNCGRSLSDPEAENKSLLNESAKSSTTPPMEYSDVVKGLLC